MRAVTADLRASGWFRDELASYLNESVDDGTRLLCRSQMACRTSVGKRTLVEGQGSHVGSHYAIEFDGHALRILVVPKQVGGSLEHDRGRGHEHISVEERASQVDTAKSGARPHPRTDHMIGTALALKVLLGLPANGSDTFILDGERVHVFDCMAMANSTLCSMVGADASGQGSHTMLRNCTVHLAQTIEILRPNVIIAQGYSKTGWSPSRAVAQVLGIPTPVKNSLALIERVQGDVAFVAAVHPSRNWFTTGMPTWVQLAPVFEAARTAALSKRQG